MIDAMLFFNRMKWCFAVFMAMIVGSMSACSVAPQPDRSPVNESVRLACLRWSSGVIVTGNHTWRPSDHGVDGFINIPEDAEAGSATPISDDGYFLTVDHVLKNDASLSVFLCYGYDTKWHSARVVWRDPDADLALLHVPMPTPGYFHWSPRNGWVPAGTSVFHIGIATGVDARVGKMLTSLKPESMLTGSRLFKIDLPLQPGDSGGAVLDVHGRLVGVNSAVEYLMPMETAIFIDSEATRPSVDAIERIIQRDRKRKHGAAGAVSDKNAGGE